MTTRHALATALAVVLLMGGPVSTATAAPSGHVSAAAGVSSDGGLLPILGEILNLGRSDSTAVDAINVHRGIAGLDAVRLDDDLSDGALAHARWTLLNQRAMHSEPEGTPGRTDAGDHAAGNSVIYPDEDAGRSTTSGIDAFVAAPFHALELLDPGNDRIGVGLATTSGKSLNYALVVDTRSGRSPAASTGPFAYPGPGSTTNRVSFTEGEWPDPLSGCASWSAPTGHPIYLVQERVSHVAEASVVHDGVELDLCVVTSDGYRNRDAGAQELGRSLLAHSAATVLIPREPLAAGRHDVSVVTGDATYAWSFDVGRGTAPATGAIDVVRRAGVVAADAGEVDDLAGDDPIVSAAVVADRVFAEATATRALVCRSDVFADCLAASGAVDPGTLMQFTTGGSDAGLHPVTAGALRRHLAPGATVLIAGGEAAVSAAAAGDLRAMGYAVDRRAGANRYETARLLAEATARSTDRVVLARGDDWPDAVAVGAWAANAGVPVLLTPRSYLHGETRDLLAAWEPTEVVVAGGAAAVADRVVAEVADGGTTVTRVAGSERAATAVAVVEQLWKRDGRGTVGESWGLVDLWAADGWAHALSLTMVSSRIDTPIVGVLGSGQPARATASLFAARSYHPYGAGSALAVVPGLVATVLEASLAGR